MINIHDVEAVRAYCERAQIGRHEATTPDGHNLVVSTVELLNGRYETAVLVDGDIVEGEEVGWPSRAAAVAGHAAMVARWTGGGR